MRYTINLDCKTHHISKDGSFPILLRVSLNGKQDYFNTGNRINFKHYDKENKEVKRGIKGSSGYNSIIDKHKERIRSIIEGFDRKSEVISIARLKEIYYELKGSGKESKYFFDYVKKRIEWEEKNTQLKTLDNYKIQNNKLNEYKPKLSIHDIDEKFLAEYKAHIIKVLGQAKNTSYHAMTFIRKYVRQLIKDGKLTKNPFDNFTVGKPFESELIYLELEELKMLHDLYDSKRLLDVKQEKKSKYSKNFDLGKAYQNVLQYFLVSCYTGLRHSDIKTLNSSHIHEGEITKRLVKGKQGEQPIVNIPMMENFCALINKNNPNGTVFDGEVKENAQTNKYLKEIILFAGIKKHITFHKARYTFAINSLLLGMEFETLSYLMGHSEFETTQRYAKIVKGLQKKGMAKWNDFRKPKETPKNQLDISCENCEELLISINGLNVIQQKKIKCLCPNCGNENFYLLDTKPEMNMELINLN
jgi:site-specific recombinase XerD